MSQKEVQKEWKWQRFLALNQREKNVPLFEKMYD